MRRENKWSRREHEESRHFLQRFTQSLIQCDEYFGFWTLACGSSLASSSALKPRLLSFGPQMSLGIFFSFIWYLWNMFEEMSFKIPSRGLRTHARPLSLEFANFPRNDFWRKARGRLNFAFLVYLLSFSRSSLSSVFIVIVFLVCPVYRFFFFFFPSPEKFLFFFALLVSFFWFCLSRVLDLLLLLFQFCFSCSSYYFTPPSPPLPLTYPPPFLLLPCSSSVFSVLSYEK